MILRPSGSARFLFFFLAALMLALVLGEAADAHVFSFRAPAGARLVSVAGTFNQWSVTAHPLRDPDGDGVWTADVPVPAGRHLYKFVVNGMDWYEDPAAVTKEDDGMGGSNSVVSGAGSGGAMMAPAATSGAACLRCPLHCPAGAHVSTPASPTPAATPSPRPAATTTPAPAAAPATPSGTTFSYRAPAGTRSVAVAGSFNNWSSSSNMLADPDGDGTWTLTTRLAPGSYQYKFVINGSDWREDPANPKKVEDGLGGTNSVIDVTAAGPTAATSAATPAAPAATPAAPASPGGTTFSYRAPAGTRSVAVAGSFNNWSSSANALTDPDGDGTWTLTMRLAPGSYQYKFVINGSDWKEDPANPKKAEDGLGGSNSVIDVTAAGGSNTGAAAPAAPAAPAAAPASPGGTTFSYRAPAGTRSVAVAGSFNNWSSSANMLTDPDGDGTWTLTTRLAPGSYQYKFVINGSDWKEDPANPKKAEDGLGGSNSVIDVTAAGGSNTGAAAPAASAPTATPAAPAGTTFSYRAPAGTRSVSVAGQFNDWNMNANPLTDPDRDGVWTATVRVRPGRYQYKFVVNGSDWIEDPGNPMKADDGSGNINSILEVTAAGVSNVGATAAVPTTTPATPAASAGTTFSYRAPAGTRSVSVAGQFNDWNMNANPLTDPDRDGVWTATVRVRPGRYQYKFVVNGSDWIEDPANPMKADDGSGNINSILEVTAAGVSNIGPGATASAGAASAPAAAPGAATFSFRAPAGTRSVAAAGTFNNWSSTATMLTDPDGDGVWTSTFRPPAGSHQYKFVINGTDWIVDPANPNKADDGFGGQNSVLQVSLSPPGSPAGAPGGGGSAPAAHAAAAGGGSAGTPAAGTGPTMVAFAFRSLPGTRSVALAGTFNNWSLNARMLSDADQDGVWTTELELLPGLHEYKFVINGLDWIRDPQNPRTAPDGAGGENSVLALGEVSRSAGEATRARGPAEGAASSPASPSLLPAPAHASARAILPAPISSQALPAFSGDRDLWAPEGPHRFRYRPAPGVRSVSVTGSFNNWNKTATLLADADGDGVWTADVALPPGKVVYKFVVNDDAWIADPENPVREDDNYGAYNSVLLPGREAATNPTSRRGDGRVDAASVEHRHDARFVTRSGETEAILTIRFDRDDVDAVEAVVDGVGHPLDLVAWDARHEYWRLRLVVPASEFRYYFRVTDGRAAFRVDRAGLADERRGDDGAERLFVVGSGNVFRVPSWARSGVLYQIFPDRFDNADRSNDPAGTRPWRYESLPRSSEGWTAAYGGDLDGVRRRLDYLASLGVTAIYLNPIMPSPGVVRYDVTDYEHTDPVLGGDAAFDRLVTAARDRGIRIVPDGVFNHASERHPFFEDAKRRGPASPTYTWFNFRAWPVPAQLAGSGPNMPSNFYECWKDMGWLPTWKTESPDVLSYMMTISDRWMDRGIAGWRLDAADEVDHDFWRHLRSRMKSRDPEAYILGEVWTNPWPWMQGDQFDAAMNYPLRGAVLDFFLAGKVDAAGFAERVSEALMSVPPQAQEVRYNHLSSHDVPRIAALSEGRPAAVRQAMAFQFGHPGLPVLYYGDELGLDGGEDPDNRRVMPWDDQARWDPEMLAWVRKLARVRREEESLRAASWLPLVTQGRILVTASRGSSGWTIQAYNASDEARSDVAFTLPPGAPDGTYRDLLSDASIEARSGVVRIPNLPPRAAHYFASR